MKKNISFLTLLLITIIWGSAFIFQKMASEHISSFAFNFLRFFIAAVCLFPIAFFSMKRAKRKGAKFNKRDLLLASLFCGGSLVIASILQQYGIEYSTPSKAGFITSCYIVIVPILYLLFRKKQTVNIYIAVVICFIGLYLFCVNETFTLQIGDALLILCAFCYAFQIICVEYFSNKVDALALSCGQSIVSAVCCFLPAILFEHPSFTDFQLSIGPVLYVAIFSTCIAYTLQIVAQKNISPTIASLVMSLESVFGAIFGFIILEETLSPQEIIGAIIIFSGVILAQLPSKFFLFKKNNCK